MKKLDKQIILLHEVLSGKSGSVVIPESWFPFISLAKTSLKLVKIFTSDDVDKYIDDIIEAIELIEAVYGS